MSPPKTRWPGTTHFRHVGISTNVADWDDESLESALSLMRGWKQPNVPTSIDELRALASDLRSRGYEAIPPCEAANEKGVCPGHEENAS